MTDWVAGILWAAGGIDGIVLIIALAIGLETRDVAIRRKWARVALSCLLPPLGLWFVWRLAFPKPPTPPPSPEMIAAQREVEETLRSRRPRA
jgi:hypothetical protein